MSDKLSENELLEWLDKCWAIVRLSWDDLESAEQAYQQIVALIKKPSRIVKEMMALNTVIKLINRMSEKDQQEFFKKMASKVKKPEVDEEFVEKWVDIMKNYNDWSMESRVRDMLKEAGHEVRKPITGEWIKEKARELFTNLDGLFALSYLTNFIRKLVEEMPARKAMASEGEIYQHGIRMTIRYMDDLMKAWQKYRGTKTLGEFGIEFLEQFRIEAGVEVKK